MRRRLPSLNALRAFEAAARHGSVSRAADELFVTHAAVSRHVRDLEAWLNVQLFDRPGRGIVLTETGASYASRLTGALDELADATREVLEAVETPQLRISVEEAFAALWLVPHLVNFTDLHPDIELSIDPTDEQVNFRADRIDIAIRYGDGNWPDVDSVLLISVQVFPVCSPAYRTKKELNKPGDLARAVLLHEETKTWWTDWLAEAGLKKLKNVRGPLFQGHLAIEAAAAGQGVALADNVSAAEGLLEGWLVRLFDVGIEEDAYYVVRAKGSKETASAQAFREWLVQEMARTQSELTSHLAASS